MHENIETKISPFMGFLMSSSQVKKSEVVEIKGIIDKKNQAKIDKICDVILFKCWLGEYVPLHS